MEQFEGNKNKTGRAKTTALSTSHSWGANWTEAEATRFKPCCCDLSGFLSITDLPKSLSATFECHVTVCKPRLGLSEQILPIGDGYF